jgi:hypothetical protein
MNAESTMLCNSKETAAGQSRKPDTASRTLLDQRVFATGDKETMKREQLISRMRFLRGCERGRMELRKGDFDDLT